MTDFSFFRIHGGGDHNEVAAAVEKLLTFLETLPSKSGPELRGTFMPGLTAMENIHPLLVHFPIALLVCFLLLDLSGSLFGRTAWRQAAGYFLYLGAVGAALTVWAGLNAAETVAHDAVVHDIMETHESLGISVLTLALLLSAWRRLAGGRIGGAANVLYQLLAVAMVGLMTVGADLGGLMVYQHGVAVAAAPVAQESLDAHEHGLAGAREPDHDHVHDHGHEHSHSH